ncbi:hypothetical protein PR048_003535 [Dryococelus australis]|uniref:Uncharacterized protein n=1 Tax=Dryococelus australis TaxID=614101 RepID=A0ABQ9IN99_9NEOP|nr:hypothetical protein PR048_003535 [Dryococelus australis]
MEPRCCSGQTTFLLPRQAGFSSPAGSPDFRKWESCRTMPLAGGFPRGSPVSPAPSFRCHSIFTSITLIGSQDLAAKSRPNFFSIVPFRMRGHVHAAAGSALSPRRRQHAVLGVATPVCVLHARLSELFVTRLARTNAIHNHSHAQSVLLTPAEPAVCSSRGARVAGLLGQGSSLLRYLPPINTELGTEMKYSHSSFSRFTVKRGVTPAETCGGRGAAWMWCKRHARKGNGNAVLSSSRGFLWRDVICTTADVLRNMFQECRTRNYTPEGEHSSDVNCALVVYCHSGRRRLDRSSPGGVKTPCRPMAEVTQTHHIEVDRNGRFGDRCVRWESQGFAHQRCEVGIRSVPLGLHFLMHFLSIHLCPQYC